MKTFTHTNGRQFIFRGSSFLSHWTEYLGQSFTLKERVPCGNLRSCVVNHGCPDGHLRCGGYVVFEEYPFNQVLECWGYTDGYAFEEIR